MICPNCNIKIFNRNASHTCSKCRYQFTFLPKEEAGLSDTFFIKKLKAISSDNTYFFTAKQLYYYLLRAKATELRIGKLILGCFLLFIGFFLTFGNFAIGAILLIIGFLIVITTVFSFKQWKLPYDFNKFMKIVISKWELQRGKIEKLIPDNELNFNLSKHSDIMDYSFDALIITGDNETANFLIKNDFHFKNKTAIVSYKKYPSHLFPYVIDQVRKNPDIPVFLVHNADIIYADMKKNIEKTWFNNVRVSIFDLGLHPHQVVKSKRVISLKRENITNFNTDLSSYSSNEQNWLKAGYYTELAIIPPVKLMNILEFAVNTYKEKGSAEFEEVMESLLIVGLGFHMPGVKNTRDGLELDFGDDFG